MATLPAYFATPNQKRGSDNRQLVSPYQTACKELERERADFVDNSQHDSQCAVDQRPAVSGC